MVYPLSLKYLPVVEGWVGDGELRPVNGEEFMMSDDERQQYTASSAEWAKLKARARELRHTPTRAESVLWDRLRGRKLAGAKFRRQHVVGPFIVDFICIESRLIIEVDGDIHLTPDQQAYDAERQAYLETKGFRVLRFKNESILTAIGTVVETIETALSKTSP